MWENIYWRVSESKFSCNQLQDMHDMNVMCGKLSFNFVQWGFPISTQFVTVYYNYRIVICFSVHVAKDHASLDHVFLMWVSAWLAVVLFKPLDNRGQNSYHVYMHVHGVLKHKTVCRKTLYLSTCAREVYCSELYELQSKHPTHYRQLWLHYHHLHSQWIL